MMKKSTEVLRPYEAVILVHPDASLEEQKTLFRKNQETVKNYKGKVFSLETWGKRNLANPIGKAKKAIFFHSAFECEPAAIIELERTMGINEKVMRFTHTKLDPRVSLAKHMENFKKGLQETSQRERDREAKSQARRAAAAAASHGD
jgi:small subunit ribosomal protein S6